MILIIIKITALLMLMKLYQVIKLVIFNTLNLFRIKGDKKIFKEYEFLNVIIVSINCFQLFKE